MAEAAGGPLDLVWGAGEIGKLIGRSERSTLGLLDGGDLPGRKVGGRWVIERSKLIAFFTGEVNLSPVSTSTR